jgi:hypothetical protein
MEGYLVMQRQFFYRLFFTLLTTLSFSIAFAQDITTTDEFAGSDPETADYNQVGKPIDNSADSLTFTNQQLGMTSPVTVSGTYSSTFGYELEAVYNQMLGRSNALGLIAAYAGEENRIDATWAHQWNDQQRTKLSIERLSQKLDFSYDSGDTQEWVAQYGAGAGYQYFLNDSWLNNIELSTYYARAEDKSLDNVVYTDSDGDQALNYRHIAGATSEGLASTFNVLPWQNSLLGLGLNYDKVFYHNKYDDVDSDDRSGFGFTVSLEQLMTKHIKLALSASQREVYDDYEAKLSWLTHSIANTAMEFSLTGERTIGQDSSPNDSRVGIEASYYLDDDAYRAGYAISSEADRSNLAAWAGKSLAYMDMVIAAADQKSVKLNTADTKSGDDDAMTGQDSITLKAGSVNSVALASFIKAAKFDDDVSGMIPVVTGGPKDVTFHYDTNEQLLITDDVVPASDAGKTHPVLVVMFNGDDSDKSLRQGLKDKLVFQVSVANQDIPLANNSSNNASDPFVIDQGVQVGTKVDITRKSENMDNPSDADSSTLFINNSETYNSMTYDSKYGGKITKTDDNSCYTVTEDWDAQTVHITSKSNSKCPDAGNIKFHGCNGYACADQKIKFSLLPDSAPNITGGSTLYNALAAPQYGSGGDTKNYTFTTSQVTPGADESYKSANTQVNDAGDQEIDDTFGVTISSDADSDLEDTVLTLNQTAALDASYAGQSLQVYLQVTNTDNESASNFPDETNDPFFIKVQQDPSFNTSYTLPQPAELQSYSQELAVQTQGDDNYVGYGSGSIDAGASSASFTLASDGTTISPADLGLAVSFSGDSITLSGTPTSAYVGQNIELNITVENSDGLEADNSDAPLVFSIATDAALTPTVNGDAIGGGAQSASYSYQFTSDSASDEVYPGADMQFSSDNTNIDSIETPTGTILTGADITATNLGLDVTNSTITLTTSGSDLNVSEAGTYKVYLFVENKEGKSATNANAFTMAVSEAPIDPVVNGDTIPTQATESSAYTYDFTNTDDSSEVFAGAGETFTDAVIDKVDGASANVAGSNLELTIGSDAEGSLVTLNTVSGETLGLAAGNHTFDITVTNSDGQSDSGTFDLTVTAVPVIDPVVNGDAISTDGTVGSAYTYDFTNTDDSSEVFAGAGETFADAVIDKVDGAGANVAGSNLELTIGSDAEGSLVTLNTVSGETLGLAAGDHTVKITVTNSDGQSDSGTFDLAVNAVPVIDPVVNGDTIPTQATESSAYTYDFTNTDDSSEVFAGAGETFTDAVIDKVDGASANVVGSNLELTIGSDAEGSLVTLNTVSGETLGLAAGNHTFDITVTNSDGQSDSGTFDLTVTAVPVIDPVVNGDDITAGTAGSAYSYAFSNADDSDEVYAGDGETFTDAVIDTVDGSSSDVAGSNLELTIGSNDSQVTLKTKSGVTLGLAAGAHTVKITVTNSDGQGDSGIFNLAVSAAATEGYLYCPSSEQVAASSDSLSVVITNEGGGTSLGSEAFDRTYPNSVQPNSGYLYQATISGSQLQCIYQRSPGDTTFAYESDVASQPLTNAQPAADAAGDDSSWSGTVCNVNNLGDTGCRVKFDL